MPLKPLQTLLSRWFQATDNSLPAASATSSTPPRMLSMPGTLADDFWIPSSAKLLPGTWVNAGEVSDKASKVDDAKIHTGLWDQRIVLVPPRFACSELEFLRPCFYFAWCQKLVQCFGRFMRAKHGQNWQEHLFKLRRLRRFGAAEFVPPRHVCDSAPSLLLLCCYGCCIFFFSPPCDPVTVLTPLSRSSLTISSCLATVLRLGHYAQ